MVAIAFGSVQTAANNGMQRTAPRAAADAERSATPRNVMHRPNDYAMWPVRASFTRPVPSCPAPAEIPPQGCRPLRSTFPPDASSG